MLASAIKDDQPLEVGVKAQKMAMFRITVARAFAHEGLFNGVSAEPQSLPARVLQANLIGKVMRTHGAIAFDDEVMCVINTKENQVEIFMAAGVKTELHRWTQLFNFVGFQRRFPGSSKGRAENH